MNEDDNNSMDHEVKDETDDGSTGGNSTSSTDSESDSNQSNNSDSDSDNSDSDQNNNSKNNQSASEQNNQRSPAQSDDSEQSDEEEEDDTSDDSRVKSNNKIKSRNSKEDFKEILENFPDALRRSSRSRKEPERFQAEANDSDDSDGKPKRRRKRKDSEEWNDGTNDDDASSGDEYKSRSRVRAKQTFKSRSSRNQRTRHDKPKQRTSGRNRSVSESESDNSDYDDDEQKKTSTRRSNAKISYKEESDFTNSDDLIEVDNTLEDGVGMLDAEEEEGEMIEKILEHRMGRVGATGLKTAPYQVDDHGDPNANLTESEETEMQFLIKWKGFSYLHCTWESNNSLVEQKARGLKKIDNYLKRDEDLKIWRKNASPEDIDYYECQEEMSYQLRQLHLNVERVIAHQPPKSTGDDAEETLKPEYFCKWEGLPYAECSWEDGALIEKKFPTKITEYNQRQQSQNIPTKYFKTLKQKPKFVPMKSQPEFIGGAEKLELRDYQLDGLNWLAQSWSKDHSVILADEMGLGKTIQTISFLNCLFHRHAVYGPFLLVVPLSTLAAWQREFNIWAPELNVVVYIGDSTSRNVIRSYEWCHAGNRRLKFNCLLTTYEILLRDKAFLNPIPWAVLGVDEAHRLKNDESFLYKCLLNFETHHRLLITGTPLQNSLRELWALLHFIMPDKFPSWESFESEHNDSYNKGFSKLHAQIQQFFLRRVKKDVEKSLPAKVEQILRVEMTSIQKQYYKWILTKNYKALSKGVKGSLSGFTNIVMELKKCCNHASLIRPVEEWPHLDQLQKLIRSSGKLLLLDKLLCRLKETGHRVLIFSQMVRMLDLLGEYLSLRRFPYQRLDGSIRGEFRKQALEHFNAEGSQDFCFLLSTRAGGLGINLATADTVIIFDSDWNPQNDLQAQARAHRIGQKNQVNIYRLVTKGSVEEDIIEKAKRKMVLDHLVIQRMDTSGHTVLAKNGGASLDSSKNNSTPFNKEELSAILKFGAQELFKETDNGDEEPQCDIDEILKRAETRSEDDVTHTLGDELLSSFKVASFNFNEEEDVSAVSTVAPPESEHTKDWDEIIPEADRLKFEEEEKQKEEMEILMLPRSRNKTKVSGNRSDSGDEYDPSAKVGDSGSEDSDGDRPKRRGRTKSSYKELIKGFTEAEVRKFVKSFKKFPNPLKRLESIAIDSELQEKPLPDLQRLAEELQKSCENILNEQEKNNLDEAGSKKNNRGPSFKLGGVTIFPKGILANQKDLEPLDLMLPAKLEDKKKWTLTVGTKIKSVSWDCPWSVEDDSKLLAGVHEYGFGNWEAIKMDPSYQLADKILPHEDLKPQAKQLQTRVEYLLKLMHKHLQSQKPKDATKAKKKSEPKGKNISPKKEKKVKSKPTKDGGKAKKKHKEKKAKKEKKKKSKDNLGSSGLTTEVFQECKEKMRAMKKEFKKLNRIEEKHKKMSDEQKEEFYKNINVIGAHIDHCLVQYANDSTKMKEWRNNLWTFVSQFTEYRPKKLYKIYRHEKMQSKGANSENISAASSDHSNTSNHHHHYKNRNDVPKHKTNNSGDYPSAGYKRDFSTVGSNSSVSSSKIPKHSYRDSYSSKSSSYSNSYHHHNSYNDSHGNRAWSKESNSFNYRNNYNSFSSSKTPYGRDIDRKRDREYTDRDRYYSNDRPRSNFRDHFASRNAATNDYPPSYGSSSASHPLGTNYNNNNSSASSPSIIPTVLPNSWPSFNHNTPPQQPPTSRPLLDTPPKRLLNEEKSPPLSNRF